MCTVCGCSDKQMALNPTEHSHSHSHDEHEHHHHGHVNHHGHYHHHHNHDENEHDHDHIAESEGGLHFGKGDAGVHVAGHSQERLIQIEQDILGKNNNIGALNRDMFRSRRITVINLLSGPGSGKTTLLVETLKKLAGKLPLAVIEGDQQTSNDAARIRETNVPALQINTGKGCHLDAEMVATAARRMDLPEGGLLFIENVGNLVCPAAFDLGETARVVLGSVTEGEDKPLKYPDIFATADLVLVSKTDLLPHLSFDVAALEECVRAVNQHAVIKHVSSVSETGLDAWISWLMEKCEALAGETQITAAHHAAE